MREIVFDVETTGLEPSAGHRVVELGAVEVQDFVPTGRTFQSYLNPERDVPKESEAVTGLSTAFLADKPLFAEVVESFLAFIGDARLVAHNASFDRGFLNAELIRAGRAPIAEERWFDTLALAREMFPGSYNSLDALCRRFNIDLGGRDKHGALLDSQLLAEVYLELNGGRERRLDLAGDPEPTSIESDGSARRGPQRRRPQPFAARIRDDERAAHQTLVDALGPQALWLRYR